eukprot:TRINITY_DN4218_c0_g1_i2.p2 TRINITY_DN4218_c0_g1~~TRINITY_DN4218_c0_g1_i2.p2  ORF type:complete len:273 (-),score=-26.14 TRINITY_DN4218_c0_g1_i2:397-1215(-)
MALALRSTFLPPPALIRDHRGSKPCSVRTRAAPRLSLRASFSEQTTSQQRIEDETSLVLSHQAEVIDARESTNTLPELSSTSSLATPASPSLVTKALQHFAVLIAAGALVLAPALSADAAQSGGRVGGQSFSRSRAAPPPPRARTQVRSNTNVYVAPSVTVAPPIYGGGFFAPPPIFAPWGWSPYTVVTPGPSVAIGIGGGGTTTTVIIDERAAVPTPPPPPPAAVVVTPPAAATVVVPAPGAAVGAGAAVTAPVSGGEVWISASVVASPAF